MQISLVYLCTFVFIGLLTKICESSFQKSSAWYKELRVVAEFGSELKKNHTFLPQEVAAWKDRIAICDTGNRRVLLTNFRGRLLESCSDIFEPRGLAVDTESGLVYVSEYYRHVIRVLRSSDLTFVENYDGGGKISLPTGVAYSAGLLYVCCNNKVLVLSTLEPNKGEVLTVLGGIENIARKPVSLAVKDDLLVVAYPEDRRLVKYPFQNGLPVQQGEVLGLYNPRLLQLPFGHMALLARPDMHLLRELGTCEDFEDLNGLCFDAIGQLLVAKGDTILVVTEDADVICEFKYQLLRPVHAAVHGLTVVVSDIGDNKVKVFQHPGYGLLQ